MIAKIGFYKDRHWSGLFKSKWYADIPEIPKYRNLMVAGADTFLEEVSSYLEDKFGRKKVWLAVSDTLDCCFNPTSNKKDDSKVLYRLNKISHDDSGATYSVTELSGKKVNTEQLWLSNVVHYVCDEHPDVFYIWDVYR